MESVWSELILSRQKTDDDLAPKRQILGVFVKNIPGLAKDFGKKKNPWLRIFCQKYTLG